jgi:hypothetical protein
MGKNGKLSSSIERPSPDHEIASQAVISVVHECCYIGICRACISIDR